MSSGWTWPTRTFELLCRRTEGWAAGLYLAALSLAGRSDAAAFIKTFAGDNRHIVDYLMAEVLDGQPPATAQLSAAHLGTAQAQRCAVRRGAASHRFGLGLGEDRAREPVFGAAGSDASLVSLSPAFGELLRAELHRSEPDLVSDLHRRAAAWFEAEGLIDEAVRHLVAAGDIAASADLIAADWVIEFNGGGLSTVSGWLDLLPTETVSQDPRLSVARAWIALNVGQLDDAAEWIEAVEAGSAADTADDGSIGAQIVVLRAFTRSRPVTSPRRSRRLAGRSPSISATRRWAGRAPTASMGPRCTFRAAPRRRKPPSAGRAGGREGG